MRKLSFAIFALLVLFSCDQDSEVRDLRKELNEMRTEKDKLSQELFTCVREKSDLEQEFQDSIIAYVNSIIEQYKCDTLRDTIIVQDIIRDTIIRTLVIHDTIFETETIWEALYDTIILRDTVYHVDTIYMAETPFILRQNCMFYVLDTFSLGAEKWFIIDRGADKDDTVKIFYSDRTYWIVGYHFKDTVVYRNYIYFDWQETSQTEDISALVITASGSICEGEYPRLRIYVNGDHFKDARINKESPQSYVFNIPNGYAEINELALEFDNDCYNPDQGEDRNVEIFKVRLNNVDLLELDPVFSGHVRQLDSSIWMPSNGIITVQIPH